MHDADRPSEPVDVEHEVAAFIQSARRLARLARALAPAIAELHQLQDALGSLEISPGSGGRDNHVAPPTPAAPALGDQPRPAPAAAPPPREVWAGREAEEIAELPPMPGVGTITVTVSQASGALDLVRVYEALTAIPGVSNLGLTSYTRSRATLLLSADRSMARSAIPERLRAAFPDDVQGEWIGDSEYRAILGPSPAIGRS